MTNAKSLLSPSTFLVFFSAFSLTQVSAGQHLHLSGDLKNNVSVAAQQGIFFNQQHANKAQPPQNMNAGANASNMNNSNQSPHVPQPNNNNPQSKLSKCVPTFSHGALGNECQVFSPVCFLCSCCCFSDATNDSYSVSQTQTINFTQQTLRQRQAQPPNAQQAPQSQSQQQSQLGMQMNMAAQNSGEMKRR